MDEPDVEISFRPSSTGENPFLSLSPSSTACSKVLIQVIIPAHHWKFVYKVPTNTLVRELLRRVFSSCHLDVFEYANYGLYIPPTETQKGKFLQEERLLTEYPQLLTSPADDLDELHSPPFFDEDDQDQIERLEKAASLKLIQKCRFVDRLPMNPVKFKQMNSKSNKKQLLVAIQSNNLQRIDHLLDRGLDPNFQFKLTGDTPLCCAAEQWNSRELIVKLVEKGAHLEFRDSDTLTPLHRAAIAGNFEAIKALLDLGQNPNVRDARDLTPLYHAVSQDIPTRCITQLLYDHAILGVMDDKNRQEIHQACLFDRPQHLEQLIIYGADLDAQAANLDTPLHICALNNHEACLRLLLKHGASRDMVNASGQTPSEVAMLTGLNRLAEIIDSFTDDQIAPITRPPVYNQDRKPSVIGPRAAFETLRDREPEMGTNGAPVSSTADDNENDARTLDRVPTLTANDDNRRKSNTTPTPIVIRPKHSSLTNETDIVRHSNRTQNQINRQSSTNRVKPRVVRLQRGSTGFGFQIRGRRSDSKYGSKSGAIANQYFDHIIPDSPAARADLHPGDYILEVNGRDVSRASHYEVTDLIVKSGSEVNLTVLPGSEAPLVRNRPRSRSEQVHLLFSDQRRTTCHRNPSIIAVRNKRPPSRATSPSADRLSDRRSVSMNHVVQINRTDLSSETGGKPAHTAAAGHRISIDRMQHNVTIVREVPSHLLSSSSSYSEQDQSSLSKDSCSLSYNSIIDVVSTASKSNTWAGQETNSSSSDPDSIIYANPRVVLVNRGANGLTSDSSNRVWSKNNGTAPHQPHNFAQKDRTIYVDQWPNVSHL